jgi:hypothetical protein
MGDEPAAFLKAALGHARRGWSVIPLVAKSKLPLVRWQPYQRQRADEAQIRAWWRQWPVANIGIVTGPISGLVVLDVDPRHDGDASLAELEHRHGALPDTIEAITGGGGRHIYFRHPGQSVRNKVGLAPGIDLRADGGLVVCPPSIHPSGRRYAWEVSHHPDDTPLTPMPDWLLRLAVAAPEGTGHPLAHWRELVHEGVAEGVRNNTIASFAGHLLWHGVDPDVVLELLLCWNAVRCRPPLTEDEVARTVTSITRLHGREHPDDVF